MWVVELVAEREGVEVEEGVAVEGVGISAGKVRYGGDGGGGKVLAEGWGIVVGGANKERLDRGEMMGVLEEAGLERGLFRWR